MRDWSNKRNNARDCKAATLPKDATDLQAGKAQVSAIAGIWDRKGTPVDHADIAAMLAALKHYGPDASSVWVHGPVALGHCRMTLSVKDAGNQQPVSFANGRLHLVADLRLDNRDELAEAFNLSECEANELSDATMLARSYERWGAHCVQHILGDYSFAIWDKTSRSWFLARDPVGSLPLYYFVGPGLFAFASMPAGLLSLRGVPFTPNEEWLAQMLEAVPRPPAPGLTGETFFRDIQRVPAGHIVRITPRGETVLRYWEPSPDELRLGASEEYHEALREQLDRAVARRLRNTGYVATHLSGGLDSSSVTATAARLQHARNAGVVAYTAVPQVPVTEEGHNRFADENGHAASVAKLYPNVQHVLITSQGRPPWASLGNAFHLYQQPITSMCNLAWLSAIQDDAAARDLHVLLSGAVGNHTISYTGLEMLAGLTATHRWSELWSLVRALHQPRGMSWTSLAARTFGPNIPQSLQKVLKPTMRPARERGVGNESLLHPDRVHERKSLPQGSFLPAFRNSIEMRIFLLQRVDSAAVRKGTLAGWRLDERDPTSDRRLIEFCLRVPASEYLRGGMPSALLRDGLADRLPPLVRYETRKGLQGTDWHVEASKDLPTLRRLVDEFAASSAVTEFIDIPKLRAMVEAWPNEGWNARTLNYRYRQSLLRSLSIAGFLRDVEAIRNSAARSATPRVLS